MKREVADLLQWLRSTGEPEWLVLETEAGLDDGPLAPRPDVVEPYRWFLERLGDGVQLTAAGYLPPSLVSETMQTLGWHSRWVGAGNREDLTIPVSELRATAGLFGLVRVYRGQLRPTPDGRRLRDDPVGLWWHLAAGLPLLPARRSDQPDETAALLWLLATAAGRPHPEDVVSAGLARFGWVSGHTRQRLDRTTAFLLVRDTTWTVFDRLGLIRRLRDRDLPPTDDAVAFARAALTYELPPPPPRTVASVELTVALRDAEPPIWRRIRVPAATTLLQLHGLLQEAMGWEDSHLHLFEVGGVRYGDVEDLPGELGNERRLTVGSLPEGTGFRYVYDFGDGWEHTVTIGPHARAAVPVCLDGARACPPEDVGGVHGYDLLLSSLADPDDERHEDYLDAYGRLDPEAFDAAEADRRMRRRSARGRY